MKPLACGWTFIAMSFLAILLGASKTASVGCMACSLWCIFAYWRGSGVNPDWGEE